MHNVLSVSRSHSFLHPTQHLGTVDVENIQHKQESKVDIKIKEAG